MLRVAVVAGLCAGVVWLARGFDEVHGVPARKAQCFNNLKLIALALSNYQEAWGSFPPACVADASGKPMHSWRVLILPFLMDLDERISIRYNFSEPWDSPHNLKFAQEVIPFPFVCPEHPGGPRQSPRTSYLAITGPGTAFPGANAARVDVNDPTTAGMLCVAESVDAPILWTEPRDLEVTTLGFGARGASPPSLSSPHLRGGPAVARVDGRVERLDPSLAPAELRARAAPRPPATVPSP
jgi:hypothetical protein